MFKNRSSKPKTVRSVWAELGLRSLFWHYNVGLSGYWRDAEADADTALHRRNIAHLTGIFLTHPGNSPSTLATYSFLTWRVLICVSISRALAGFLPNISSPEVSLSSLNTMDTLFASWTFCDRHHAFSANVGKYIVKTFRTCEWSSGSWVPAPWRGWTPLCCACSGRTGGRGWRRACRPPRGPRSSWSPGSWSQPPAPRVWKLNILIVYKYWFC